MAARFLNVLNVNMSVDPVSGGGTAERTIQLSRSLVKSGHACTVLALDIGLSPEFKERLKQDKVDAVFLPCLSKRFYLPSLSLGKIAGAVKRADIVHLMGHWTLINVVVFIYSVFFRKPYVVCPAGALPVFGRNKAIKKIYNFLIGDCLIKNANGHVAITRDEVLQFSSYGVSSGDIEIIPNGINPEDFKSDDVDSFRRKYGLGVAPFILFMGRLNEIKGPDLLLEAFGQLSQQAPSWNLVFVGPDGGMLNSLKNTTLIKGLKQRVHYLGYLGGIEKSQAYHAADFLVIPSRQEAMSIVVLEAGAAGLPVLLTDQCGFDEVEAVGGGKIVSASVDGLRNGLESMLDCNELSTMGERLKAHVCSKYTWADMAGRYGKLYKNILGRAL